jgi:hypothetical protein
LRLVQDPVKVIEKHPIGVKGYADQIRLVREKNSHRTGKTGVFTDDGVAGSIKILLMMLMACSEPVVMITSFLPEANLSFADTL